MSYPDNDPRNRAWGSDDETQQFDNDGYGTYYDSAPDGRYANDDAATAYYQPQGAPYYSAQQQEPAPREAERAPRRQRPPRERRAATLSEMFRLVPLLVEMVIIAIIGGILYGMICWVFDLLAVRLSDSVHGHYLAMDGTFEYTMRGIGFGIFVLIGAAILVALAAAVNRPAQIFGWLFIAVLLWAAIVLLTNPLWQSVPEVLLLLIGAGIIWAVLPLRVASYRTSVPRLY